MSDDGHPDRNWNDALAEVIKKEAEQSEALYILHYKSSVWAKRRNDALLIPASILSTITGFFSATSSLVPPVAIGALSVIVGILGFINSHYKYGQRAENHKMCSNMYHKLYKDLEIELSLPIKERNDPDKILPELRAKMARIAEISEPIPESIILEFKRKHNSDKISLPLIANGLNQVVVFKETVVLPTPKSPAGVEV